MGKIFTEISEGLKDAANHAKGNGSGVVAHTEEALNVKAIREKTGMSQERFYATFGISLRTLRDWEQDLSIPHGAARVLLKLADKNPKAVVSAVQEKM